jgi:hypothetical protein
VPFQLLRFDRDQRQARLYLVDDEYQLHLLEVDNHGPENPHEDVGQHPPQTPTWLGIPSVFAENVAVDTKPPIG